MHVSNIENSLAGFLPKRVVRAEPLNVPARGIVRTTSPKPLRQQELSTTKAFQMMLSRTASQSRRSVAWSFLLSPMRREPSVWTPFSAKWGSVFLERASFTSRGGQPRR